MILDMALVLFGLFMLAVALPLALLGVIYWWNGLWRRRFKKPETATENVYVIKDVFDQGRFAGFCGANKEDNPYPVDEVSNHQSWDQGWREGHYWRWRFS